MEIIINKYNNTIYNKYFFIQLRSVKKINNINNSIKNVEFIGSKYILLIFKKKSPNLIKLYACLELFHFSNCVSLTVQRKTYYILKYKNISPSNLDNSKNWIEIDFYLKWGIIVLGKSYMI